MIVQINANDYPRMWRLNGYGMTYRVRERGAIPEYQCGNRHEPGRGWVPFWVESIGFTNEPLLDSHPKTERIFPADYVPGGNYDC